MAVLQSSVRFRHVVFADDARRARRPIDFTPRFQFPATAAAESEPACGHREETFLRWLFLRVGLDARVYRMETLNRRLSACLRMLNCSDVAEARQVLADNPHLFHTAISTLVIGVTSFFRDEAAFAHLRDQVLPKLCGRGRRLRVWSVGCSDGHELYSVALLLAERRVLHACDLLGTDCRADAVRRAREGLYDPAAVRHVPPDLLKRYFVPIDGGSGGGGSGGGGGNWQVARNIRSAVRYRVANALAVQEPGYWDLILCRNMAMYLQPDAAATLWQTLERGLCPGGILMLGKAERPAGVKGLSYIAPCLYGREGASN